MSIVVDHPFEPDKTGNPRNKLRCWRCCRRPDVHPEPRVRDSTVEDRFVYDALDVAQRSGWPVTRAWTKAVFDRLEMGDREYGNRALERDNIPDILEECPDLGSYSVLEFQRLLYEEEPDTQEEIEDRLDLLAIAAHGAAAHYHGQRILRRRAGLDD